jgi:predicted transcriptional regulator
VGRRIEEAIELIEMELRHAAAYVNDAVIPQVRTESISALRSVADAMRKFADRLEQQSPRPDQQTSKAGQPPQPPTQGPRT